MAYTPLTETFTLPSGTPVTVREMTGADEDILMNEKLVRANKAQHQLLGNVIVELDGHKPTSQDVQNMWSADRAAVLLHARVLSFGPELSGVHECDNVDCKNKFSIQVDDLLHDLEYRPAPENFEAIDVDLPSGLTATMRPMRGADENRLLQARQKGDLMTELLFSRIVEVSGLEEGKDGNRVREWLRSCRLQDRTALRKAMEAHEFGYQTQILTSCPVCYTEQRVDVMSLPDFFFPGSRG